MAYIKKETRKPYVKKYNNNHQGLIDNNTISALTGKTTDYINIYFDKIGLDCDFRDGNKKYYLMIDVMPHIDLIKLSTKSYNIKKCIL
jgi:hypothetical protein